MMENWMSTLPDSLKSRPLQKLLIPGSHNSATCDLDRNAPIVTDQPQSLRSFAESCGPLAPMVKSCVYNWSKCQNLSITEQLKAGVRYLDLRIGRKSGSGDDGVTIVHGLYGPSVDTVLLEIIEFATEHPAEIIILDFNHFYSMNAADHLQTVQLLLDLLSDGIVPQTNPTKSVRDIQSANQRFIVFYQIDELPSIAIGKLWQKDSVISPWTQNTASPDAVIAHQAKCAAAPRPPSTFCVNQFIPSHVIDPKSVLKLCSTSLEKENGNFMECVQSWYTTADKVGLNVVCVNFVTEGFAKLVVDSNTAKP